MLLFSTFLALNFGLFSHTTATNAQVGSKPISAVIICVLPPGIRSDIFVSTELESNKRALLLRLAFRTRDQRSWVFWGGGTSFPPATSFKYGQWPPSWPES